MSSSGNDEANALVLDAGSGWTKAGFAGDDGPRAVFPSVIGKPRQASAIVGLGDKPHYVGHEAVDKRGVLKLSYPIEHGIVTNFEDAEKLWWHAFAQELKVAVEEHPVIITEAPASFTAHREKTAQIFFESFRVPAMYMPIGPTLSLFAAGRTTGLVLESGEGMTHSVPIYEGYALRHAIDSLLISGRDLTYYLVSLLNERSKKDGSGFLIQTTAEREIVRSIKEQLCFVGMDYEECKEQNSKCWTTVGDIYTTVQSDMERLSHSEQGRNYFQYLPRELLTEIARFTATRFQSPFQKRYALPDGNEIVLCEERFTAAEPLFSPGLLGQDAYGIHEIIWHSIRKSDSDIRSNLFENVVLGGGNTLFPGMRERVEKELRSLALPTQKINVIAPEERKYSAWIGGSTLACLSTFPQLCISRAEYEENGPKVIHRKWL